MIAFLNDLLSVSIPMDAGPDFHLRPITRTRGAYGKRIIKRVTRNGRTFELHATKGWRSYRAGGGQ